MLVELAEYCTVGWGSRHVVNLKFATAIKEGAMALVAWSRKTTSQQYFISHPASTVVLLCILSRSHIFQRRKKNKARQAMCQAPARQDN
jgi:hypothetical protein